MEIRKTKNGSRMKIELSGRLDTITAPELEKEAVQSLDEVKDLVIDLKDLEYVSSAGLRVFLKIHRMMSQKGSFVLRNCSDEVKEILDVTGFLDIFTVE